MTALRPLDPADLPAALGLLARAPEMNVHLSAQLATRQTLLGWFHAGELRGLAHAGGNFTLTGDPAALPDLARHLAGSQPLVGSIVGERELVLGLWDLLAAEWPQPARLIRQSQPYLALHRKLPATALRVRPATRADLAGYQAAAAAMFAGEVGMAPPGRAFAARISGWVEAGRSYGWFAPGGQTLFKLDVGAVAGGVAQVQGIWLAPAMRGQGLAADLIAEALGLVQADHAPVIALYVNDFNLPALAAYRRVGFEQVGEYATVFF